MSESPPTQLTGFDPPALTLRRSLVLVMAGLIAVGLVSGTLIRHLVQILPLVAAYLLLRRSCGAGSYGAWIAVGLLAFWFAIMVLIWLFLLGISDVASGTYTFVEIILTVGIAGGCLFGVVAGLRRAQSPAWSRRAATVLVTWLVQYGVMLLSFSEPFVNR